MRLLAGSVLLHLLLLHELLLVVLVELSHNDHLTGRPLFVISRGRSDHAVLNMPRFTAKEQFPFLITRLAAYYDADLGS